MSNHPLLVVADQFIVEDTRSMGALRNKAAVRIEQMPTHEERIQFLETRVSNLIGLVMMQTAIIAKGVGINGSK